MDPQADLSSLYYPDGRVIREEIVTTGEGTTNQAYMSDTENPKEATILPDSLHLSMPYDVYFWLALIFGILLLLAVILLIVWAIGFMRNAQTVTLNPARDAFAQGLPTRRPNLVSRALGIHDNPGGTFGTTFRHVTDGSALNREECQTSPTATWNGRKCSCIPPFWGPSCERESYSLDYIDIGNIPPEDLPIYRTEKVHRQSFPLSNYSEYGQTYCDALCNDDTQCVGYAIDRSGVQPDTGSLTPELTCSLLCKEPVLNNVSYNPNYDSNTFLKRNMSLERPRLPNRVFLYNGKLRNRFWVEQRVNSSKHNLVNIGLYSLNHLRFYPRGSINDSSAILVFSDSAFTKEEATRKIEEYISSGTVTGNWYVYIPEETIGGINIPFSWSTSGRDYWVMAIPRTVAGYDPILYDTHCPNKAPSALNVNITEIPVSQEPIAVPVDAAVPVNVYDPEQVTGSVRQSVGNVSTPTRGSEDSYYAPHDRSSSFSRSYDFQSEFSSSSGTSHTSSSRPIPSSSYSSTESDFSYNSSDFVTGSSPYGNSDTTCGSTDEASFSSNPMRFY